MSLVMDISSKRCFFVSSTSKADGTLAQLLWVETNPENHKLGVMMSLNIHFLQGFPQCEPNYLLTQCLLKIPARAMCCLHLAEGTRMLYGANQNCLSG